MACDTAGTMLQTFEAIKQAVGLDIPQMLKDVSTGGLVGKATDQVLKPNTLLKRKLINKNMTVQSNHTIALNRFSC